jgi:GNAT superfamily N-acetyltransferase
MSASPGPRLAGALDRKRASMARSGFSGDLRGSAWRIRQAVPDDRAALEAMLARCTPATRHGRFHAPVRSFPEPYLGEALAGRPEHFALVAEHDGAAIALASCRIDPDGGAELGLLVEDRWQRRGIGTRLLNRLIQHADNLCLRPMRAKVLAEQAWILRILRTHGTCQTAITGNALDVTMHRALAATQADEQK